MFFPMWEKVVKELTNASLSLARAESVRTLAPTFSTIRYHHLILLGPTTLNDEPPGECWMDARQSFFYYEEVYSRHDLFTSSSLPRLLRTKASNLSLWKGEVWKPLDLKGKKENLWRAELRTLFPSDLGASFILGKSQGIWIALSRASLEP